MAGEQRHHSWLCVRSFPIVEVVMINRNEVGVRVNGTIATFGVYLPGVKAADGFSVFLRLIHQADQFVPEIPSV